MSANGILIRHGATTDVVANLRYLTGKPTVLPFLFAAVAIRQDVATVDLAKQLVDELYQVTITCAAEGN